MYHSCKLLQNVIFQKHDMSYSIGTKTRIFYYLVRFCTVINSSTNFIIYCSLCREFRCSVNMCMKKVFCLVTKPAVSVQVYEYVPRKSQITLYFIQEFKVNKYLVKHNCGLKKCMIENSCLGKCVFDIFWFWQNIGWKLILLASLISLCCGLLGLDGLDVIYIYNLNLMLKLMLNSKP